jgi:SAM-dependent methyltransferase
MENARMSQLSRVPGKSLEDIDCPICHNHSSKICFIYTYEMKRSNILECSGCGHLFIDPVPLVKLDSRSMDNLDDGELFGSRILRTVYEKVVIDKEINLLKKYCLKGAKHPALLDIACGTGWTTSIMQKRGFDVTGLESSVARSQYCRDRYDLKVVTGFIENFEPSELFDIVTMRHILEHIEHPVEVLEKVRSFLKKDGILLITLPNINSIGRYIFQEHWTWVLPWHLHFYHPKTLELLLTKMGFKKLSLYQMPSPLWYPEALRESLGPQSLAWKILSTFPRWLMMALFTPVILLGAIFKLNDNQTIIVKKID